MLLKGNTKDTFKDTFGIHSWRKTFSLWKLKEAVDKSYMLYLYCLESVDTENYLYRYRLKSADCILYLYSMCAAICIDTEYKK